MEKQKINMQRLLNKLLNISYDIEERKYSDAYKYIKKIIGELNGLAKTQGETIDIEYEQKDSIKIVKNTKNYNYEFRLVAKDGIDLLSQVDFVKEELEKRTAKWQEERLEKEKEEK